MMEEWAVYNCSGVGLQAAGSLVKVRLLGRQRQARTASRMLRACELAQNRAVPSHAWSWNRVTAVPITSEVLRIVS